MSNRISKTSFFFLLLAVCAFADIRFYSQDTLQIDTTRQDHFQRYSAVPVLGYTEETRIQCGAMVLLFLRPNEENGKVPEIGFTAYGSSRGQLQLTLEPYIYFYHDKISLWMDLEYQDWIASYFGRGNSPDIDEYIGYNRKKLYLGGRLEFRIGLPEQFKYGVSLHIENSDIEFDKDGSVLPPDPSSGQRNGVGYLIGFDSRDNTNWTKHGFLIEWEQLFYNKAFGDYSFDVESFDVRGYTTLPGNVSAAVGAIWKRAEGNVPFDMLAGPDGIKRFRGVESLYFGDNQALILQAELRRHFVWLLGGHVFFEGGKSGEYFSDLMRNKWHRSIGFGALLALNLQESLFARADVSWVDVHHVGLSFYVRQAF